MNRFFSNISLKFASLVMLPVVMLVFVSASDDTPQKEYVRRWAQVAVREMYRSGVPASITLAQGLLESNYGRSELAIKGNNHFGIKCHNDWKGKTIKADDDRKGECFRVYSDIEESFRDHSDFLRYSDRYKSLFDLQLDDYEAWAVGLKAAGYATDPSYANKLIKIIEDYDLSDFDSMSEADVVSMFGESRPAVQKPEKADKPKKTDSQKQKREKAPAPKKNRREKKSKSVTPVLPEAPSSIEAPILVDNADELLIFNLTRDVYTQNGVPFVYAIDGDSYESIASEFNLFLKEILAYNELRQSIELDPGTVVYLELKKTQTQPGLDKYIVEQDGETLYDICQRFAVRTKSVMKLNKLSEGHEFKSGDTVILRRVK